MKLLKPLGCPFSDGGGNVKELTTLVEGQGIGFRTGVRLPSSPFLKEIGGNSIPTIDNLYALSALFETSVDDILKGSKGEDKMSSSFAFLKKIESNLCILYNKCMFMQRRIIYAY